MHSDKHIFALYYSELSRIIHNNIAKNDIIINDKPFCHRINNVLRLRSSDSFFLFDQSIHVTGSIKAFHGKSNVEIAITDIEKNKVFTPHITFVLPLLKRIDLEAAIYALVEQGVSDIQLIKTAKVSRKWGGSQELERINRIVISASEQSKNFAFPIVHEPIPIEELSKHYINEEKYKFYFDPDGKALLDVINTVSSISLNSIVLVVGPEGGLTVHEKEVLQQNNYIFCALTPTILRAVQAASLSAGVFRSIFT